MSVAHDATTGRAPALGHAAAQGLFWLLGQTFVSRAIQAATQIALAWLLSPADFGVIAIALTVTHVVATLFTLGFDDVLLQRRRGLDLWGSTLFWLSLATGILAALVMIGIGPLVAWAYGQPRLLPMLVLLAISNPIGALGAVPATHLRHRLDFRALSVASLLEIATQSALSVALAVAGGGAFSVIAPMPVAALVRVAALWRQADYPEVRRSHSKRWPLLVPSASAALGTRLLATVREDGDYVILGLLGTTQQVGLYFFAFRIAVQPVRAIAQSFANVLFPTLVRLRDTPARQAHVAMLVSQMLSIIVMPLCMLQAVLAEPFLASFFDARWAGAGLVIALLSLGLGFDAISWAGGVLLPSRGEFRADFRLRLLSTPMFPALVAAGASVAGAEGAAAGVALFYAVVQPAYAYAAFRRVGRTPLLPFTIVYLAPALASGGCALVARVVVLHLVPGRPLIQLLVTPIVMLAAYVPLARVVAPVACAELRSRVSALLRR